MRWELNFILFHQKEKPCRTFADNDRAPTIPSLAQQGIRRLHDNSVANAVSSGRAAVSFCFAILGFDSVRAESLFQFCLSKEERKKSMKAKTIRFAGGVEPWTKDAKQRVARAMYEKGKSFIEAALLLRKTTGLSMSCCTCCVRELKLFLRLCY